MSSETNNTNYNSNNDDQDAGKKAQQQMLDGLDSLNASLNSSVNSALGLKSMGDYASDGLSMMSGNATSSIQDATFNDQSSMDALNGHNDSAKKQNKSMNGADEAMNFVAENPEVLAIA